MEKTHKRETARELKKEFREDSVRVDEEKSSKKKKKKKKNKKRKREKDSIALNY